MTILWATSIHCAAYISASNVPCRFIPAGTRTLCASTGTMPLYELLCIAAYSAESALLRDLIRSSSRLVLDNGGAVRGVQYWGRRTLPQRARAHQQWHTEGDYFLMQFDTNPRTLETLYGRLRADPRVVKYTALKLGDKLQDIVPSVLPASGSGIGRIGMGGKTIQ
ncbi:hypothetical protein K437DRAFT_258139, partial [Tilletiaria anomala UBC 951]